MNHFTPGTTVEIVETEYPVMVQHYDIWRDSAGPGHSRGGIGLVRQYRLLVDCILTARTSNYRQGAWGLNGGVGPIGNVLGRASPPERDHRRQRGLAGLESAARYSTWCDGVDADAVRAQTACEFLYQHGLPRLGGAVVRQVPWRSGMERCHEEQKANDASRREHRALAIKRKRLRTRRAAKEATDARGR